MSDRHNDGVTSGTDSGVGTGFALGATACSKSSIELGTVRIGGVQYTVGAMIFFQGIKKEKNARQETDWAQPRRRNSAEGLFNVTNRARVGETWKCARAGLSVHPDVRVSLGEPRDRLMHGRWEGIRRARTTPTPPLLHTTSFLGACPTYLSQLNPCSANYLRCRTMLTAFFARSLMEKFPP